LNRTLQKEPKGPGGRPPFDYVMMFKILILQRLYNISDAQVEYQIKDRLSFMRFLGLALCDTVGRENDMGISGTFGKGECNRYDFLPVYPAIGGKEGNYV
jgi:hypothetical protein